MRHIAAAVLLAIAAPLGAETTLISWDEAEKHVGSEVTVRGRILGVHCSPTTCLLAFDPTFGRFTAVIRAENFDTFPPDRLDDMFSGKKVQVHGTIVDNDGKPEIVVAGAGDLKVALSERVREEREADADRAQLQLDLFDRLGQVLERIEALTERMATTQERMESVLAQLEQRSLLLAQQQGQQFPQPAVPPENWGAPQPRPAYEALRTVKSGMTPEQVARLIGEPDKVEYGSGGWSTWYYGFGRSISFDTRGRVRALSGFPKP